MWGFKCAFCLDVINPYLVLFLIGLFFLEKEVLRLINFPNLFFVYNHQFHFEEIIIKDKFCGGMDFKKEIR